MRIFLDLDGTIVDFVKGVCPLFGVTHDEIMGKWPPGEYDMTKVLGITEDEFFGVINGAGEDLWANLPMYDYGMDVYHFCKDIAPTFILTRPTGHSSSLAGKLRLMQRQFGSDFKDYVLTWKKELCASPDSVLIDDHVVNCTKFADAGGSAIVWPAYNNLRHGVADRCVDIFKEELVDWHRTHKRRNTWPGEG